MRNCRPFVRLSSVLVLVLVLAACGDRSAQDVDRDADRDVAQNSAQNVSGSSSLNSDGSASPAPAASPAPTGGLAADLPMFTPKDFEVRQAMQQLLIQKAMTAPASPQRDAWFQAESKRLASIQVGKCTTAPIGTPSVCHVSLGGKASQIKILLTRSGWMLVK